MNANLESREHLLAVIGNTLAEILERDSLTLSESTTAGDVPGWDSINHVKLLLALEDELGFRFELDEVEGLADVGRLVDIVQAKVKDAGSADDGNTG